MVPCGPRSCLGHQTGAAPTMIASNAVAIELSFHIYVIPVSLHLRFSPRIKFQFLGGFRGILTALPAFD